MRIAIATSLVLMMAGATTAQETPVDVRDVPEAVRKAADKAITGVKWASAMKGDPMKGDKGWYKLSGRDAKARTVVYFSSGDGKEGWFEREVDKTDVPAAVTAALKAKVPDFVPKRIHALGLEDGSVTAYRFQGAGYEGGDSGVLVSANGKKVTPTPTADK